MPKSDDVQAVIDQLCRGPAIIRQLIYEMPPDLRKRRPAPGMWSAHEHAVHLPAIYPLINRRLDLMLSDPNPYIKGYEPSRDEPDDALLKLDLDAEMDRFDRERSLLVDRLRKLTPDAMDDHCRARRVLTIWRVHHVPPHRATRYSPRVQNRRSAAAQEMGLSRADCHPTSHRFIAIPSSAN